MSTLMLKPATLLLVLSLLPFAAGCQLAATGHNVDGKRLYSQGQLTSALQSFQKAVAADPKNADAYYNMAATYHRMGTQTATQQYYSQAEALYNQCLDYSPDHIDCHRALAILLVETNRSDRAFTLLTNWATRNPSNADAYVELARLNYEFQKKDVARQYLDHAYQLDPRNWRALNALAMMREESGDVDQALANYQRSYQLNRLQPNIATRIASLQQSVNSRLSTSTPGGTRMVTPTNPSPRY